MHEKESTVKIRFSTSIFFIGSLFVALQSFAKKDQLEIYFEKVSTEVRDEVISRANVSYDHYLNEDGRADVLAELNSNCKNIVTYSRDEQGQIIKPTVNCIYIADDNLDGMSPKFKCKFKDVNGESKKLKVKYSNSAGQSGKEIATGILGPSMARLMGFKADTYCPAIINCEGCSADPWSKDGNNQAHSSKPAISGMNTIFNYALIEIKLDGLKVSEPRNGARKPLGFDWAELRAVDHRLSAAQQDQVRIEREAYMLWINFIYHTDADAHNNRLVCEKVDDLLSRPETPYCGAAAAYAHDYGDSFRRMKLADFINTPVFFTGFVKEHPLSSWGTEGNKCVGTMGGGEGAIGNAEFSEEAKKLFLERASRISKVQLIDLMNLADVSAIDSSSTAESWANAILDKFNKVSKKSCTPYSNGDSVLHP
jgi:hypothetical protein